MTETSDLLQVQSLFAGYGRYDVIRDVSMRVGNGEAVALLGPNGAGKTSIARAIVGSIKHRRGEIRIQGRQLIGMSTRRIAKGGYVAMVPEGRRLFLDQSIEDNLLLGALRIHRERERVKRLYDSVYQLFPVLKEYGKRPAGSLSGGQQQMVAIGRMLMADPALLLLDEPSLGLAPLAVQDVAEALKVLRGQGRSILLIEQRVELALDLCERIYVLSGGEIVAEEEPGTLDRKGRALIDAYLG